MSPVGRLTGGLVKPWGRLRDGRLLDAAMAAGALIARADGGSEAADRRALLHILSRISDLEVFDVELAAHSFADFADAIRRDGDQGRARALKAVSEIAGDADGAQRVVQIGRALARASGGLSPAAREQIGLIAAAAGAPQAGLLGGTAASGEALMRGPHVITLAGAKGGTGKSTVAVHLAVALIKLGHKVGSIDLDAGQGTMSRYLAHRASLAEETGQDFALPRHLPIEACRHDDRGRAEHEDQVRLAEAIGAFSDCGYVVIDTPGSDCPIAWLGCTRADTLITPLNDSLIDIDVLARIDRCKRHVLGPSTYSKRVWKENDRRVARGRRPIDWVVMRNRLAPAEGRNSREITGLLQQLAQRMGFRLAHGLGERVVFRELFLHGLTVLDFPQGGGARQASHSRAREEIDTLLQTLRDGGP